MGELYFDNKVKNISDLYNFNKDWYDKLFERKYLNFHFLPSCNGNTLNVGVHFFNKKDEICCNNNCHYETIDIHEQNKEFGSSKKHTTCDFLNYEPEYKFDNIILFGVLGIYNGLGGYKYTLHRNEEKTIEHADKLLNSNGRILLGPDINPDSGAGLNSYSTEEFWNNVCSTNEILKKKYTLEEIFTGWGNMIIILKRNK
tara:strand:+ start:1702 stop:2301 length:600 start_codon:yes stop_codon:yes gene_type:complete